MINDTIDEASLKKTRQKTVIALICIVLIAAVNQVWLWGMLFATWSVSGMILGRAYLIEEISSDQFPQLCWCVNLVWLVIGLLMIAEALGLA